MTIGIAIIILTLIIITCIAVVAMISIIIITIAGNFNHLAQATEPSVLSSARHAAPRGDGDALRRMFLLTVCSC